MNETYLYTYSAQEARRRDEISLWRASHRANVACKEAIEEAVRQHYDGAYLDNNCLSDVLQEFGYQENISYTLTATDHHAVFSRQRVDKFVPDNVTSTESARQHKDATDLVLQTWKAECPLLIRRLTPLECERLQGFPDGWTNIPSASDSARYKALGNSVAIPCVEFILRGIVMTAKTA